VGRLLAARVKPRRGELALYAGVLVVSPRTLRKWRDQAGDCPLMGRPPHAEETWRAAVVPVARAWKVQGRSSGRPRVQSVLEEQGIVIPSAIVRELLRLLKARWRRVQAWKRAQEMKHVEVKARDALWSQDATHLGRDEQGKVEALAVKDAGSTTSIAQSIGGPACGADVLALLGRAKLVRGVLPLVLAMDNGPANKNELVTAWLRQERVIVLWNVPHTPQHNAWAESFNGELKTELGALGELLARGPDPSQGTFLISEAGSRRRRATSARACRGSCSASTRSASVPHAAASRRRSLTGCCLAPRISCTVLASTTQPVRRSRAPCRASTTLALDGVPNAKRSSARSNNSVWSNEPEVEGPRHAPKRNDFRDTHNSQLARFLAGRLGRMV
jgi:transposase InsO family protein